MPVRDALRLLTVYLRPQWPQVLLLAALLFGGIALQLINPQLIAYVLDSLAAGTTTQALSFAALLFIFFSVGKALLAFGASYVGAGVAWSATNELRAQLTSHCLRLEMAFHTARTPGTLITRVDGDAAELGAFFSHLVLNLAGNGLLVLGVLVILFLEDWRMGVVGLAFTLVTAAILQAVQRRTTRLYGAVREAYTALYGMIEERLAGTEDIRANGGEAYVLTLLSRLRRTVALASIDARMMGVHTFSATHMVFVLATLLGLAAGAMLYLEGQVTIGTVYVIVYYIALLQGPLEELRDQAHDLQQAAASVARVQTLLQRPSTEPADATATLPSGALALRYTDVSFAYAAPEGVTLLPADAGNETSNSEPGDGVLQKVTFDLAPGEVLGLLGHTGSGKSSLIRLLVRLYGPDQGQILLGGIDVQSASLANLRQRVAVVTQEVQIFQASLRDNISFFDPRVDDTRILAVLQQLGLWRWYSGLPRGLDTMLGAGGTGLSAGEAQLLALVRVFLQDPGLVILDEASSRLDPATEQLLEQAIDELLAGRTAIVIAHRLRTVQRVDSILILDNGRVAESGPRAALAADRQSRFYHLLQVGLEEALA